MLRFDLLLMGLCNIRSFVLLDANNRMITQRQEPTLTLVKPKIMGPYELLVEADGREPLKVTLAKSVKQDDTVKNFKYSVFVLPIP